MKAPVIALSLIGVVTLTACGKPAGDAEGKAGSAVTAGAASKEGTPLAIAGGDTVVTLEDYREKLMKQSPFLRARYDDPERKKEFLDNMLRVELLAREAQRRGLDQDPEVQESLKKIMVQHLIRQLFEEAEQGKLTEVTEESMRAFYDEHIDDYVKPATVRVSHVFVQAPAGDAAARAEARKKAKAVLAEIRALDPKDHTAFNNLVREKSDDGASRAVGGDLQYLSSESLAATWGAPLAEAAFGLAEVGEFSDVVESDKGFHVLKLTGRQKAINRGFEQVKPTINQRLSRQSRTDAFEQFIDALKKKENVKVELGLLDQIDVTGGAAAPDAMHGGQAGQGGHPMRPAPKGVAPAQRPAPGTPGMIKGRPAKPSAQ